MGWISPEWATFALAAVSALIGSISTGAFFVARTEKEIETLKQQMDEGVKDRKQLRVDMRTGVHDLRNEMQLMAKVEDVRRIEAHLKEQDRKVESRLEQIIYLLADGRAKPK